jgi:hypothetical protein
VNPPPPPGVPGLLVSKVAADGSILGLQWDTAPCTGDTDHQVVFGLGAGLPAVPGGVFTPSGGQCAIGSPPFNWGGVPDPAADPERLLWFVVLATNGSTLEGSWGKDSAGNERSGPGPNGFSGQCVSGKDFTNACP